MLATVRARRAELQCAGVQLLCWGPGLALWGSVRLLQRKKYQIGGLACEEDAKCVSVHDGRSGCAGNRPFPGGKEAECEYHAEPCHAMLPAAGLGIPLSSPKLSLARLGCNLCASSRNPLETSWYLCGFSQRCHRILLPSPVCLQRTNISCPAHLFSG